MTLLLWFLAWFCAGILTCWAWAAVSLHAERRRVREAWWRA